MRTRRCSRSSLLMIYIPVCPSSVWCSIKDAGFDSGKASGYETYIYKQSRCILYQYCDSYNILCTINCGLCRTYLVYQSKHEQLAPLILYSHNLRYGNDTYTLYRYHTIIEQQFTTSIVWTGDSYSLMAFALYLFLNFTKPINANIEPHVAITI